jgi:hypothetical protein
MRILRNTAQGQGRLILSDGNEAVVVRARATTVTQQDMGFDSIMDPGDGATAFARAPLMLTLEMDLMLEQTALVSPIPKITQAGAARPKSTVSAFLPTAIPVPLEPPTPKTGKEERFEAIVRVPTFDEEED